MEDTKEKANQDIKWKELLNFLCLILLIIGLGMFSINQTLNYFYKSEFLQTPCELCLKVNTHLDLCQKIDYNDEDYAINFSKTNITIINKTLN